MAGEYVFLDQDKLDGFVASLAEEGKVVAPVRKGAGSFAFAEVLSAKEISWKYVPTILPPKKYFMPQYETLQRFDKHKNRWQTVVCSETTALLGVHTCDLAGIEFLDKVMLTAPSDAHYRKHRESITLVGIECLDYCDSSASCAVMRNESPRGGYDLFMTEIKKGYVVHVGSERGKKIASNGRIFVPADAGQMKELEAARVKKKKIFKEEVAVKHEELKDLFGRTFESRVWSEDLEPRCLSCGNCTNVCPTCYCFDILDKMDLNLTAGTRQRVWDSCQNETFARVAGGENFRKPRGARQRHRYLRKFYYPVQRFKLYGCTGCGRCTRTCMAKISLKETINALARNGRGPK